MNNAFQCKTSKRRKDGTVEERDLTIGAVVVTTVAMLVVTMTGHTIWNGIAALVKVVRGW